MLLRMTLARSTPSSCRRVSRSVRICAWARSGALRASSVRPLVTGSDQGGKGEQRVEMALLVDPVAVVCAIGWGDDALSLVIAHGLLGHTRRPRQIYGSHGLWV
jgi:hypothetical protein